MTIQATPCIQSRRVSFAANQSRPHGVDIASGDSGFANHDYHSAGDAVCWCDDHDAPLQDAQTRRILPVDNGCQSAAVECTPVFGCPYQKISRREDAPLMQCCQGCQDPFPEP